MFKDLGSKDHDLKQGAGNTDWITRCPKALLPSTMLPLK